MTAKVKKTIEKGQNDRAKKALDIIGQYYLIAGEHHKNWVVVEAVKVLCGSKKAYEAFVDTFDDDSLGEDNVCNGWKEMVKDNCIPP